MRHSTPTRCALAVLAVLGAAIPWSFNIAYFAGGGSLAPQAFLRDAAANALAASITVDVYLAALAFSVGVAADRAAGRLRWLAIPACFGIALAFALPAYLLWRSMRKAA